MPSTLGGHVFRIFSTFENFFRTVTEKSRGHLIIYISYIKYVYCSSARLTCRRLLYISWRALHSNRWGRDTAAVLYVLYISEKSPQLLLHSLRYFLKRTLNYLGTRTVNENGLKVITFLYFWCTFIPETTPNLQRKCKICDIMQGSSVVAILGEIEDLKTRHEQ